MPRCLSRSRVAEEASRFVFVVLSLSSFFPLRRFLARIARALGRATAAGSRSRARSLFSDGVARGTGKADRRIEQRRDVIVRR